MKDISKVRFEALAAYCRRPETLLIGEEVRWLESNDEELLIVLIRDRSDNDFGAIILARDMKERYRHVDMSGFFISQDEALAESKAIVEKVIADIAKARVQGDEKGKPIDFFTPIKTQKLNADFLTISTVEGYSPAVEIIKPMMRWYEDADGNFIEQFQTSGFDARLWELYIFAMLTEAGYAIDRSRPIPDFSAKGLQGTLYLEATTLNPTKDKLGGIVPLPPIDTEEELLAYIREYVPIKYAGSLTTKLAKKYWELPNVQGHPLVIAIQDFHAPMSMTLTKTSLSIYLYGYDHDWKHDAEGNLVITPRKVSSHKWGNKEIDSGFFNLPGAENISAVLTNSSATISKFNRMGVLAGFGSKNVQLIRKGFVADFNPNAANPKAFELAVNSNSYHESWIEGMDVYHNPNAKYPLKNSMLLGAAHHRLLKDGTIDSKLPEWHPLSSLTYITVQE